MIAEETHRRRTCYRRPRASLFTSTAVILTYGGFCVLMCILAASGVLLNDQSFECGDREKDASRLQKEASLVYLTAGLNVTILGLLMLTLWLKDCSWLLTLIIILPTVFFVAITLNFAQTWEKENEGIQAFKERYLALLPLTTVSGRRQKNTSGGDCVVINNVLRWQEEFKCCGLEDHKDWGSKIPRSCLCGAKDDSSACIVAGDSLVHMKPCFPTVLSLVTKRSSTFWIIMIVWMTVTGVPAIFLLTSCFILGFYICCTECYILDVWKYKLSGGEEMVPVVFIRKDNNNETEAVKEEESAKDGDVKEITGNGIVLEVEEGAAGQGEGAGPEEEEQWPNALTVIPLSLLERLQKELDPPPVQHQVRCLCLFSSKPKNFYIVTIEESSPLLPGNAVLADATKPTNCVYAEGPHVYSLERIVWPQEHLRREMITY